MKDGTLVDDGSANLQWEAAKGKTIERFEGMSKEESLISLIGGEEAAKNKLTGKGIVLTGEETTAELGALIVANFTQTAENGGGLSIDFSSEQLSRDWKSINTSYVANESFFTSNSWIAGKPSLLADLSFRSSAANVSLLLRIYSDKLMPAKKENIRLK